MHQPGPSEACLDIEREYEGEGTFANVSAYGISVFQKCALQITCTASIGTNLLMQALLMQQNLIP